MDCWIEGSTPSGCRRREAQRIREFVTGFSIWSDPEWQVTVMEKLVSCATCARECVCVCVYVCCPQVTHAHHVIILITRQAVDLHGMQVDAGKNIPNCWQHSGTVAVTVNYIVYAAITNTEFNQSGQYTFFIAIMQKTLQLTVWWDVMCSSLYWLLYL